MSTSAPIIVYGSDMAAALAALRLADEGMAVQLVMPQALLSCPQRALLDGLNIGGERAGVLLGFLERAGVPFDRNVEGELKISPGFAAPHQKFVHAGLHTAGQILNILESQLLRFEAAGRIVSHVGWDFASLVLSAQGDLQGVVLQNRQSLDFTTLPCEALIVSDGPAAPLFSHSVAGCSSGHLAVARLYEQGALLANPEFLRMEPLSYAGPDGHQALPLSWLDSGATLWTERRGEKWYFLSDFCEGKVLSAESLSHAIHRAIFQEHCALGGHKQLCLDISALADSEKKRHQKTLKLYEKLTAQDPAAGLLRVAPAVAGLLGGLWTDDRQMSSLPGVFAVGEAAARPCLLEAFADKGILANLESAFVAAGAAIDFVKNRPAKTFSEKAFVQELGHQREKQRTILEFSGPENVWRLSGELAQAMNSGVFESRDRQSLNMTLNKIHEIRERWLRIGLADRGTYMNRELCFVEELRHRLLLAEAIVLAALRRTESRGAHWRRDFPQRDDARFASDTRLKFHPSGPEITYGEIQSPVKTGSLENRPDLLMDKGQVA